MIDTYQCDIDIEELTGYSCLSINNAALTLRCIATGVFESVRQARTQRNIY